LVLSFFLKHHRSDRSKKRPNNQTGPIKTVVPGPNSAEYICPLPPPHEEALVHMQKGLEIELKLLGNEPPSVADSFNDLACAYGAQGKYQEALEMHKKKAQKKMLECRFMKLKK
jgi:hypothetical protein